MKQQGFKSKLHQIIFESDTKAGKLFDEILILMIILSITVVALDSVPSFNEKTKHIFHLLEWCFTALFTLEYAIRIWTTGKPLKYIFSFYGIIDFLSIVPTYIGVFFPQGFAFASLRMIRLVRIFRILKLVQFLGASKVITQSLKQSRYKITVFFTAVLIIVTVMGAIMYMVEGPESGFNSIPHSIYWAIVTITTVGYGDISPITPLGQFIASLVMLLGYAIIAVPTGIISSELINHRNTKIHTNTQTCQNCNYSDHDDDAKYCKVCGTEL
ncbi:MAG: ion transporter [Bacteroidales bacterium]|nr:ion transporter [Bacteroidales bacterium]